MKKRLQGLVAGVLIGTLLTSGVVFAKQSSETISVIYDNIKILIDGKEYQPTDVNGNVVEPFIYNGTTYLPVRAIANAFDKEVDWEAQTSTVALGNKNYDWLDQMGYVDYETTGTSNTFSAISKGTEMTDGIKYDRGIAFQLRDSINWNGVKENNDGTLECFQSVSYKLNKEYKDFSGIIAAFVPSNAYSGRAQIKFYGDGQLIYSSPLISDGTKSTKFNIDVSNVKLLKIFVEYINISGNNDRFVCPSIADARLSKK